MRKPSNQRVGAGPIENISRNIVDATRVRIPDSRGSVMTITVEASMTVQMSIDKWEFKSANCKKKI